MARAVAQHATIMQEVDELEFSREVVLSAAYALIGSCFVHLESAPRRRILVRLTPKPGGSAADSRRLGEEFQRQLHHQSIREQIRVRTQPVREVLVGRALLQSPVEAGPPREETAPASDLNYLDDPLGIAIPWEEKYGNPKDGSDGNPEDNEAG